MLVYLVFIFIFLYLSKTFIFRMLIALFSVSVIGAILIEQPIDMLDVDSNINSLFICSVLFLIFIPFNSKKIYALGLHDIERQKINDKVLMAVVLLSSLAVMVNLYILSKSINYFISGSISVSDYKNLGHAEELMLGAVNPILKIISSLFSPLSYICLSVHFYALIIKKSKLAFLGLFGSLNIVIIPLFYFARGGVLTYCMLYACLFLVVLPLLPKDIKAKIFKIIFYVISPIFLIFLAISVERFSDYHYFRSGTFVSNHVVFAIFDYMSQWIVNSNFLIDNFETSKMIFGSNFSYIPGKVLSIVGVSLKSVQELRESVLMGYENHFNGIVTLLLYDFGYIGTLFVAFLFFLLVSSISRGSTSRPLSYLISMSLLLPIPIFFFQGLFTVFGFYNIAVLYGFLFSIAYRVVWRKG